MGSDKEFQKHETKRVAGLREQERADLTAATSGRENGRILDRFGFETKQVRTVRKEREKQAIAHALKISAAYSKLYSSTMFNLHDTRNAVYEAQLSASMELEKAQTAFEQTIEHASKTPDGVAVFRAADGHAYDRHGQKLDDDVLMGFFWVDDAPSWEDYKDRLNTVEAKQERFDRMSGHSIRIDEIEEEMESLKEHDTPENTELMIELNQEMQAIKEDAQQVSKPNFQVNNTHSKQLNDAPLDLKGFDM